MTFTDVHGLLGRSFLFFSALITLWALLQTVRGREIGGDFWGAVAIGEGLIVLQTIVGIILVLQHRMPARPIHFVYGGVALLLWPAVFAFTRGIRAGVRACGGCSPARSCLASACVRS